MDIGENSQREQTTTKRTEFKQVRLNFGIGDAPKQIVPERKKKAKTTNLRFFNDEDCEFNLPKNISNEELMQYLKMELMNIENKMAQLTIRKHKILELLNGVVESISNKFEDRAIIEIFYLEREMKYEHIELDELIITQESLKKLKRCQTQDQKLSGYENSIINLTAYNFDAVDYSLFPLADSDNKDDYLSEENPVYHNVRSMEVPGVTITNQQFRNEIKRLNNIGSMNEEDIKSLGSQYGIKSEDEQIVRKCLQEIKEFYQKKKLPEEYLVGYSLDYASRFMESNSGINK